MATDEKYVDILLVGKTGNGKSATGNSLLGKKDAFESKNTATSVTVKVQFEFSEFEGRSLKVVDGPGVGDTSLKGKESVKRVVEAVTYAIAANPEGYHAILLVVRYGGRFTEEDVDTIKILKDIFGENFVKIYTIVVVTCGDNFERDAEDSGETFEQWCKGQDGFFRELFLECQRRVVLIDNKLKDEDKKAEQTRRILAAIESLSSGGNRYTNEQFQLAKKSRERLYNDLERPTLREDIVRDCGLIMQQLSRVDLQDPISQQDHLKMLKEKSDKLYQRVVDQDRGTKALSSGLAMVKTLKEAVAMTMRNMEDFAQIRKLEDGMMEKLGTGKNSRRIADEEEKQRQEERRRREAEEEEKKSRIKAEERMKREEERENKRQEEERRRQEKEERRLKEIKDDEERRMAERREAERREAERRETERREAERKEAERREAERREEERKREEQRREEERKQREREEAEWREKEKRMEKEVFTLKLEKDLMEKHKAAELELEKKKAMLESEYKAEKEKQTDSWAGWGVAGALAAPVWNAVSKWWQC